MKATLQFDLPEEEDLFRDANNATKVRNALEDFASELRDLEKYQDEDDIGIEIVRRRIALILTAPDQV